MAETRGAFVASVVYEGWQRQQMNLLAELFPMAYVSYGCKQQRKVHSCCCDALRGFGLWGMGAGGEYRGCVWS